MSEQDGPWTVDVSGEARRHLQTLPFRVAPAIVEFITGPLAANPHRLSKPLTNDLAAYRSARRGDYRVLIRLDTERRTMIVIRIQLRGDVYRPR